MSHNARITAKARVRRDRALRWLWAVSDAAIWMVAVCGATWLRFDFALSSVFTPATMRFALVGALAYVAVGSVIGPYAIGHRRGSFEETLDIARTVTVTMVGVFAWVLLAHPPIPRSVPVMGGVLALTGMFAVRFVIRTWRTHQTVTHGAARRVIGFGAGEAGRLLLMRMVRDGDSGFTPVAVLDDDRSKGRLRIEGLRVRGTRTAIADVARQFEATTLVIALPLADATLIRELTELAETAGLDVFTLPPLSDLLGGHPNPGDLHEVNLSDLLGRRPITLDTTVVAEQISGRRVLVTGAGGSIGSELCRQIARFGPAKLYLLDRDESGIQGTQLSLTGQALLEGDEVDVERFFMLIPEACQLVLEAAVAGTDGEVMVLDMGEPVRIVDVARTLIRRSGRDPVDIVFTGLRPGEKLSEDLFADDEYPRATSHCLISSVHVPAVGCVEIKAALPSDHRSALAWMRKESLGLLDKPARSAGSPLPTMSS